MLLYSFNYFNCIIHNTFKEHACNDLNIIVLLLNMEFNNRVASKDRIKQFERVQKEGLELFIRKNSDYKDAFAKYGTIGVLMRIEDKLSRCLNISRTGVSLVSDEQLRDTLIDLHNYAAMACMLYDEDD